MNAWQRDGCAEHCSVENRADGAVGAFPHFMQVIFRHALVVGGDGGTFHCHTIFFCSFGSLYGNLVSRLVAFYQSQVVVFRLQVNKGKDKFVLDHLPQDSGHLVTVHFDDGGGHLNFFHSIFRV